MNSTPNIPMVDLSPWFCNDQRDRRQLADTIGRICHETGFLYVVNHQIDSDLCRRYMSVLKSFFALPEDVKMTIHKKHSRHFRGWESLGSELTNNQIDYREQVDIGLEQLAIEPAEPYYLALLGPNQWLQEELLPGFRNTVLEYIAAISKLSRQLLGMMSLSLGLEQNCIESIFGDKPAPYTKLICYPQTRPGSMGVGEHKDSGFITILLQDCLPGLEARSTAGEWMTVDPVSDSLVVNIGELMQMMSANYFVAAPHRVRNVSDQVRYSSAFFDHPDLRAAISPLPIAGKLKERVKASKVHSSAGLMPSVAEMASGVKNMQSVSKPTSVGEKYWRRWVRSYPDIARHYYGDKSLLL